VTLGDALRSRAWQAGALVLAFALIAVLHRDNDGLWYGDAPLHAANGLFWWDLLTSLPRDPVDFAVRYYARYPVIKPAGYPPLFYLLEGAAFAVAGPSPYVARVLVLLFAMLAGAYVMAWSRRWIDPAAGWAGAFLAFVPGIVIWSTAVMLNVPATALGLASLYHLRRWLEAGGTKQLALAAGFVAAVLLTYFQAITVTVVCAAVAVPWWRRIRVDRRAIWIAAIGSIALVPLAIALLLGPVQAVRNLPSVASLVNGQTPAFYARAVPQLLGVVPLALGCVGLALAAVSVRWRMEAAVLGLWVLGLLLSVLPLPARDPRYILLIAPACVLAAALGVACAAGLLARIGSRARTVALVTSLAVAFWGASQVEVPRVTGFKEAAEYLKREGPGDAVLWDGTYGAVFAFYVRALDPKFERRLVAANKFIYEYGPTTTFRWTHTSSVSSAAEVVDKIRTQSGCRWVALAVPPESASRRTVEGRRLLRDAVARPEFQLVRSFPTSGAGGREIEIYRFEGALEPAATVDLRFSSFSNREFRQVVPITR
jgi:4-amino-4-deoxy-L-arabinose transferase-like glycosyltransferase